MVQKEKTQPLHQHPPLCSPRGGWEGWGPTPVCTVGGVQRRGGAVRPEVCSSADSAAAVDQRAFPPQLVLSCN